MSIVTRAASLAAISFCAFAASGAFGSQAAPAALNAVITTPIPPAPVIDSSSDTGIAAAETLPPQVSSSPATSLAELVALHDDEAVGADVKCLATAVYFEAKGEPLAGQLAVAEVILNRTTSGRFAPTVCGVVKQPSQFSFVRGGVLPAVANNPQWRRAVGIARVALDRLYAGPGDDALFFHARRVSPGWGKRIVASVGNHIFYR